MSDQLSNSAGNDNLDAAVAIANQYANTILLGAPYNSRIRRSTGSRPWDQA